MNPLGSGLEWILHTPLCVVKGDWMGQSFVWYRKKPRPCVTADTVWHDKDPSLLKDPESRAYAKILQPFTGNGDVSIQVKNSWAGRRMVDNQWAVFKWNALALIWM
jgi:hypothetical protein